MQSIRLAFSNLLRNRRRTLMTLMVISVGVAAMLTGGGFALYTYTSLEEMSAREEGHLIVAHQHYFDRDEESPLQYGLDGYRELRTAFESELQIRAALPMLSMSGLISNGERSEVFVGDGVDPALFRVKGPFLTILEGHTLPVYAETRAEMEDPPVMVAKGLARKLGATVGSSLTLLTTTVDGVLNALDVRVHGIYSTGVPDLDARNLMVGLETAQSLMRTERVSQLGLYLVDDQSTLALHTKWQQAYPDLAIQSWRDRAVYYEAVRGIYNRIFGMLGGIVLLMVFFAIANALTMSVIERTREIGTLRALGTYPYEVVRNFILEAVAMSSVGVLLGSLLALSISLALLFAEVQMPPPPGRSVGYPLQITIDLGLMIWSAIGVTLLSALAAWISSRKAARKPIPEALAHV